jgi:hypothetical protein
MNQETFSFRQTKGASILKTNKGYRLTVPASKENIKSPLQNYRLAQLDDYTGLTRRKFLHHSLTFGLRARASSNSILGTWGFGLWNDPFGFSPGFGGNPFRLPALPNAVWFFHASPQSYLSFHNDKPAAGFIAQTFRSRPYDPMLVPAGLVFPLSQKTARRLLRHVIGEDAVRLGVDVTQWHSYKFEWRPTRVVFEVDNIKVLETTISPRGPLGLVVWIDNQYAAFRPDGKVGFGVLKGGEEWIEVEDIGISS